MSKIKGMSIFLIDRIEEGKNPFGESIFIESPVIVENVLIVPTSTDDVINQLSLTGKKAVYTLGIPKGDTHNWEDKEVEFFGKRWRTFGAVMEGLEHLIPLDWNRKVMVESYE